MPRGKALLPKSAVKTMYKEIIGGWEPTYEEIKERYIEDYKDEKRRDFLTRSLISRVRRMLKKDDVYFYHIPAEEVEDAEGNVVIKGPRYKILTSVSDYDHVTQKMWKITEGFRNSTDQVLTEGVKIYPPSAVPLLNEVKAHMGVLHNLAGIITSKFTEATNQLKGGNESEDFQDQT